MEAKIKAHLKVHLQVLKQLLQCLEEESVILRKGSSDEILSLVDRKQRLIQQLNELEVLRIQLLKTETFESLQEKYPEDFQFKHYHQEFSNCCEKIQQLSLENHELTVAARKVVLDRMTFYTELVRDAQTTNSTYTRGGAYAKTTCVGSTILERIL